MFFQAPLLTHNIIPYQTGRAIDTIEIFLSETQEYYRFWSQDLWNIEWHWIISSDTLWYRVILRDSGLDSEETARSHGVPSRNVTKSGLCRARQVLNTICMLRDLVSCWTLSEKLFTFAPYTQNISFNVLQTVYPPIAAIGELHHWFKRHVIAISQLWDYIALSTDDLRPSCAQAPSRETWKKTPFIYVVKSSVCNTETGHSGQ